MVDLHFCFVIHSNHVFYFFLCFLHQCYGNFTKTSSKNKSAYRNSYFYTVNDIFLSRHTTLRYRIIKQCKLITMCAPEIKKNVGSIRGKASISQSPSTTQLVETKDLAEGDEWIADFDFAGFADEIKILGKKLESEQGPADVDHLNKMILWSNSFAAVGLLSMGLGVNPITVMCLSMYTFTRWTMIAHHVCHGGYEKVHPNKSRWSRFKFGIGTFWRRFNDWFDWMMPEAWNVEHNTRLVL